MYVWLRGTQGPKGRIESLSSDALPRGVPKNSSPNIDASWIGFCFTVPDIWIYLIARCVACDIPFCFLSAAQFHLSRLSEVVLFCLPFIATWTRCFLAHGYGSSSESSLPPCCVRCIREFCLDAPCIRCAYFGLPFATDFGLKCEPPFLEVSMFDISIHLYALPIGSQAHHTYTCACTCTHTERKDEKEKNKK